MGTSTQEGESEGGSSGDAAPNSNAVDILFVIDNSGSMGSAQGRLAAAFPTFIDKLEGASADYRIGITTTDNGNPVCGNSTSPEAGRLQLSSCLERLSQFVFNGNPPADATATACTDVCILDDAALTIQPTTTEFDAEPKPRRWLENIGGKTNLPVGVGVAEALQCFAPQGIAGCGFEQPLESMSKAVLRSESMLEMQHGFLRSDAMFLVIIVSDETDCSYDNAFTSIFISAANGGDPVFWTDPEAAQPTSAVCWRAGVSCSGGPGEYDECHAENKDVSGASGVGDDDAVLWPISRYVDQLQAIEDARKASMPGQEVMVALLTGVPANYPDGLVEIPYRDAIDPQQQADFGIAPGCEDAAQGVHGIPPVREREVAEAFTIDDRRHLYSICETSYAPALESIATAVIDRFGR